MPLNNFTYSISWSDFTQLPSRPSSNEEDAQIHPDIAFSNFKLARKGNAVTLTDVDVNISLVSADCWVVSSQMSSDLLKHEQGHYDIIALTAREFYNKLIGLSASSVHALQTTITDLQKKFQQKSRTIDNRYDTQTAHSQNATAQQTWNSQIATEKLNQKGSIDNLPQ